MLDPGSVLVFILIWWVVFLRNRGEGRGAVLEAEGEIRLKLCFSHYDWALLM